MMRYILMLSLFAMANMLNGQKILLDKVVAKVGGEILLQSEVEESYALMVSRNQPMPPNAKCTITDQLLMQKLLLNQAKLDSLEISDAEVEGQLNARFDQILGMMGNDPSQFEEFYGQSIPEARSQMKDDMKNQILAERMRGTVVREVKVTPSEVKAFFNEIHPDSLPYFNSEVEIGEIVFHPEVNKVERQKALDRAEKIWTRIVEGGEDFAALATKFSDDTGSARLGGDLGWQKRGGFVMEFEAAAYNLGKDEISEVTETDFGFHIIQLLERRGNRIHTRHILITPEITAEDKELAKSRLDSIAHLISVDSLPFPFAVRRYSDDKIQSYNNGGLMLNPKTGNTFFEIGDLDPDVYFAIDTMEVGGVSAPIEFLTRRGETSYRMVLLKSRTAPHKANLKEDYSKIKNAAIESKKTGHLFKWLEEKLSETYIFLNGVGEGCDNLQKWTTDSMKP